MLRHVLWSSLCRRHSNDLIRLEDSLGSAIVYLKRYVAIFWTVLEWSGDAPLPAGAEDITAPQCSSKPLPSSSSGPHSSRTTMTNGAVPDVLQRVRTSGRWWHRSLGYELMFETLETW